MYCRFLLVNQNSYLNIFLIIFLLRTCVRGFDHQLVGEPVSDRRSQAAQQGNSALLDRVEEHAHHSLLLVHARWACRIPPQPRTPPPTLTPLPHSPEARPGHPRHAVAVAPPPRRRPAPGSGAAGARGGRRDPLCRGGRAGRRGGAARIGAAAHC